MFNVAIIEKDKQGAMRLKGALQAYLDEKKESYDSFVYFNPLDFLSDYRPIYDLIFMEVDLPHIDGIQTAKRLREIDPNVGIIFFSDQTQQAIHAYEVDALDFIPKAIGEQALKERIKKAYGYVTRNNVLGVIVSQEGRLYHIPLHNITYIEVSGHTLTYHTINGNYQERGTLNKIAPKLLEYQFFRPHKSYLVNLRRVEEVRPRSLIVGGEEVYLSRDKKDEIREIMLSLPYHISIREE